MEKENITNLTRLQVLQNLLPYYWEIQSTIINLKTRYVIIDKCTGYIVDDAQGYGFGSYEKALRYAIKKAGKSIPQVSYTQDSLF